MEVKSRGWDRKEQWKWKQKEQHKTESSTKQQTKAFHWEQRTPLQNYSAVPTTDYWCLSASKNKDNWGSNLRSHRPSTINFPRLTQGKSCSRNSGVEKTQNTKQTNNKIWETFGYPNVNSLLKWTTHTRGLEEHSSVSALKQKASMTKRKWITCYWVRFVSLD